jgi:hypothetical protein
MYMKRMIVINVRLEVLPKEQEIQRSRAPFQKSISPGEGSNQVVISTCYLPNTRADIAASAVDTWSLADLPSATR